MLRCSEIKFAGAAFPRIVFRRESRRGHPQSFASRRIRRVEATNCGGLFGYAHPCYADLAHWRASRPRWILLRLCIPTRVTKVPTGPDWLHEIKHDGYRLIVRREGSHATSSATTTTSLSGHFEMSV